MNTQTANGHEPKYKKHTRLQTRDLMNWFGEAANREAATTEKAETLAQRLTAELKFSVTRAQVSEARQELGIQCRVKRGPDKKPKRTFAIQVLASSLVNVHRALSMLIPKELEELAKE